MRSRNCAPKNAARSCCDTVHFPAGYDDQAYIFTKSMPAEKNIKLCRKGILPQKAGYCNGFRETHCITFQGTVAHSRGAAWITIQARVGMGFGFTVKHKYTSDISCNFLR